MRGSSRTSAPGGARRGRGTDRSGGARSQPPRRSRVHIRLLAGDPRAPSADDVDWGAVPTSVEPRYPGPSPAHGRRRRLMALVDLLREGGYEPVIDEAAETVRLRNCPYRALVSRHQELTCGMNLAWTEGVTTAIDAPLRPELIPTPGYCCVAFRPPPESRRTGAPELVQPVSEPDRE